MLLVKWSSELVMQSKHEFNQELAWVRRQLPRLEKVTQQFGDLSGTKIALSTHLDIKMIPLFEGLLDANAELFITTCDPNTVRDQVVSHLIKQGAVVHALSTMREEQWRYSHQETLGWDPDYICEFGGELVSLYHQQKRFSCKAALEGTGSGIAKLRDLELNLPVLNWDELDAKEGLHNRHMVGLMAWQTFCQRTRLTLHEKHITLIGYGLVGQGVAAAAKAYGGRVTVVEKDPARKLMAAYDGWHVDELDNLLERTDVLVTATGVPGIIGLDDIKRLKDNAFVMNVGHGSGEINMQELTDYSYEEALPFVCDYNINGKHIFVLANGGMFNLTAGFGDSLNAFDATLAIMAGGLNYLVTKAQHLEKGLHLLPDEAWKPALR